MLVSTLGNCGWCCCHLVCLPLHIKYCKRLSLSWLLPLYLLSLLVVVEAVAIARFDCRCHYHCFVDCQIVLWHLWCPRRSLALYRGCIPPSFFSCLRKRTVVIFIVVRIAHRVVAVPHAVVSVAWQTTMNCQSSGFDISYSPKHVVPLRFQGFQRQIFCLPQRALLPCCIYVWYEEMMISMHLIIKIS